MTKISNLYTLTNYISTNSSGNVVIAAPASGYALDVTGTGRFTNDLFLKGDTRVLYFQNSAGTGYPAYISAANSTSLIISANQNIPLDLRTNDATRIYITSGGYIGMGTTTPSSRLQVEVAAESPATGQIALIVKTSNGINDIFRWYDGATQLGVFKNSGFVGIGTASPSYLIHARASIASIMAESTSGGDAIIYARGGTVDLHGIHRSISQNGVVSVDLIATRSTVDGNLPASVAAVWTTTNHPLVFATNNTEKMRINANGEVGINVTPTSGNRFWVKGSDSSSSNTSLITQNGAGTITFLVRNDGLAYFQGGNVGIGTTSPNSSLAISISAFSNAGLKSYTTDNVGGISAYVNSQDPYTGYLDIYATRSGDGGTLGGSVIRFLNQTTSTTASAVERMRITSDGLLQFSTTNVVPTTNNAIYSYGPNGYLYIQGGTTGAALAGSGDRNNAVYVNTSINSILFHTNGAGERMRITSGGQIAIGTSNPQSGNNIQVNSTSPIFALYSGQTDTTTNLVYSTIMFKSYAGLYNQQFQQPDAQIQIVRGNHSYNGHQSTHDADMVFSTNDNVNGAGVTERMRIWSTGELVLVANSGGSNHIRFINNNGAYWEIFNATNYNKFTFIYQGSYVADINPSSGAYTALSDERKKKDIEASNIGLSTILALQPSLFRMKTDDDSQPKQLGFIAQQVESVLPEACSNVGDYLGVQDRPIVAALVKAIQELSAKVTALENK